MRTESNRALLHAIFDGLASGDSQPFLSALSEDFTWIAIGTTDWSGAYRGRDVVRGELLRPLMSRFKSSRNRAERILVDGDWAAVQCRGTAETVEGKRYDNTYCWVVRLHDGLMVEVTEYLDTKLLHEALGPYQRQASAAGAEA